MCNGGNKFENRYFRAGGTLTGDLQSIQWLQQLTGIRYSKSEWNELGKLLVWWRTLQAEAVQQNAENCQKVGLSADGQKDNYRRNREFQRLLHWLTSVMSDRSQWTKVLYVQIKIKICYELIVFGFVVSNFLCNVEYKFVSILISNL